MPHALPGAAGYEPLVTLSAPVASKLRPRSSPGSSRRLPPPPNARRRRLPSVPVQARARAAAPSENQRPIPALPTGSLAAAVTPAGRAGAGSRTFSVSVRGPARPAPPARIPRARNPWPSHLPRQYLQPPCPGFRFRARPSPRLLRRHRLPDAAGHSSSSCRRGYAHTASWPALRPQVRRSRTNPAKRPAAPGWRGEPGWQSRGRAWLEPSAGVRYRDRTAPSPAGARRRPAADVRLRTPAPALPGAHGVSPAPWRFPRR